jgi:hypothetical protein
MKLCLNIVISAMFLIIPNSSTLRLLLPPKLSPAINPWLRLFKLIKGMFFIDWVLNLLSNLFLHCHRSKTSLTTMSYLGVLKGMLDQKLILSLLMSELQWNPDANPKGRIRGRRWWYLSQCQRPTPLSLPFPLFAQDQSKPHLELIHWCQTLGLKEFGLLPLLIPNH